ncbi:MAG: hypothetical protein ACE5E5_13295, partial [Phycisphaerae bacterium]
MKRTRSFLIAALVMALTHGASVASDDGVLSAKVSGLLARNPGLRVYRENGVVRSFYGRPITAGSNPFESAERFRLAESEVFGVAPQDLLPESYLLDNRHAQQLMYDPATDSYKFTLIYFRQYNGGFPVFRSDMRLLVRNEEGFPLVMAKSGLRPLGSYVTDGIVAADAYDKAVAAAKQAEPDLLFAAFALPETQVWAGYMEPVAAPKLALVFNGTDPDIPAAWLFVADAKTGEILYKENQIITIDITGNVTGVATEGTGADICENHSPIAMPHARVTVDGTGEVAFADEFGDFVIPHAGTGTVSVRSAVRGDWFRVFNAQGADAQIVRTITPPGPAIFLHNDPDSQITRAQVDGYVQSNVVRDFTLQFNPAYPVIPTQHDFTVNVNQVGGICPNNAFYSAAGPSINFCLASGGGPNMAWSSVIWHEYGHHLIQVGGSGQGAYGEGMADSVTVVISDESGTGFGFGGNCNAPLRDANNNCQYSASSCTTNCGSEVHACGRLMSGAVWSTRNALLQSDPTTYRDIIASLTINSIPMHSGSSIAPDIAVDFLTLDDDDGNINNGTPHYSQICTGFNAHGLTCPELAAVLFEYPNGRPDTVVPDQPTSLLVNTVGLTDEPVPGTGKLAFRVGPGLFTFVSMTELAPNQYEATLPAAACGDTIDYFFQVQSVSSGVVTDPPNAGPTNFYSALSTSGLDVVAEFDFETNGGWTVSGSVSDGPWDRGVPISGCDRGNPQSDFDGSGACWLTDNTNGVGGNCNSDVDGGTTILTSPVFDLSLADAPRVSYARWYSNTEGAAPQSDIFVVRVSSNGGASWVDLETVGPSGPEVAGGWFNKTFLISDFVSLTDQVRFRFEASDLGAGSVVEAALDAFSIVDINCIPQDAPPTVVQQPVDTS